jgi:hypothetical protein
MAADMLVNISVNAQFHRRQHDVAFIRFLCGRIIVVIIDKTRFGLYGAADSDTVRPPRLTALDTDLILQILDPLSQFDIRQLLCNDRSGED